MGVIQEQVQTREDQRVHHERTRDLMVLAVEALDVGDGHVKRVAQLCTELADLSDLSVQLRSQLFEAAHYHDSWTARAPEKFSFRSSRAP